MSYFFIFRSSFYTDACGPLSAFGVCGNTLYSLYCRSIGIVSNVVCALGSADTFLLGVYHTHKILARLAVSTYPRNNAHIG